MNKEFSNEAILDLLRTAIEAPLPDGLLDKATAVNEATRKEQEQLGFETLIQAALFCDDMQSAHPHLDKAMLFRTAASSLMRIAALVVRSAKRMEGSDLDPAKFALVNFELAHDLMQIPFGQPEEVLGREPGRLRQALLDDLAESDALKYGPVLGNEINALPERLRRYMHAIEQRADPAGDVRRAFVAEEKAMALEVLLEEGKHERGLICMDLDAMEKRAQSSEARVRELARELTSQANQWRSLSQLQLRDIAGLLSALDSSDSNEAAWRNASRLWKAETAAREERIERLTRALEQIAMPMECGCLPCTGQCRSAESLQIEVDAQQDLARAALAPPAQKSEPVRGVDCNLFQPCEKYPECVCGRSQP